MSKMKIEFGKDANMVVKGKFILKSLQNMDMPILDLLVRESIQNSIDAYANYGNSIDVYFDVCQFSNAVFASYFESIEDRLIQKFGTGTCYYLSIRDCNTFGLNGPLHRSLISKSTPKGNLLKLVYDIGQAQTAEGAGGSWGLGKTIYYRVGIGLVVFYSRTRRDSGNFEHRLAACLIENEEDTNSILFGITNGSSTGTAWWGEIHNLLETKPITDENFIDEFLRNFGIKKYSEDETGTTIVIPYIDREQLLDGTSSLVPSFQSDMIIPWRSSIEEYLRLSCQRWYFPRISNKSFKYGKPLRVMINNHPLNVENFEPIFKLLQKMYQSSATGNVVEEFINTVPISLTGLFINQLAGSISFLKATKEILRMLPPDNCFDPYIYTGTSSFDSDRNSPIICFSRKPGMIVSYQSTGDWVDGIEKTLPTEYIIGIFVLNSENKLADKKTLLEEYVRKSEKSDHTSWTDTITNGKNLKIIERIQRNVRRKIKDEYSSNNKPEILVRNISMGRLLADKLLPKKDFGKKSSDPTTNVTSTSQPKDNKNKGRGTERDVSSISEDPKGVKKRSATISIDGFKLLQDGVMKLNTTISLMNVKSAKVMIESVSENRSSVPAEKWEDSNFIGAPFPFDILEVEIVKSEHITTHDNLRKDIIGETSKCIDFIKTTRFNTNAGFIFRTDNESFNEYNLLLTVSRKIIGIEASFSIMAEDMT